MADTKKNPPVDTSTAPPRIRTRKPTEAEKKKLETARTMKRNAQADQRYFLSKIMPTYRVGAIRDEKIADDMRKSVPEAVRTYEGMEAMKKGGKVKKSMDGAAKRGKTRGKMY